MKGIQVCSNEGPRPFQREDNWEKVKINRQLLKIFFSRTTGISTKLGTKYPGVKGIQVIQIEGHARTSGQILPKLDTKLTGVKGIYFSLN